MIYISYLYEAPLIIHYKWTGRYIPMTRIDPGEYPEIEIEKIILPNGKELLPRHENLLNWDEIFTDIEKNH